MELSLIPPRTRSLLWSQGLCHHSPPKAIPLPCVSWDFGQVLSSCLGHGGAGEKVGEPMPRGQELCRRWHKDEDTMPMLGQGNTPQSYFFPFFFLLFFN